MPRRRELRGVALGVLGSFVSRYNDVGGYWGLGQLCSLAKRHGVDCVEVDILGKAIHPAEDPFRPMLENYARRLERQMTGRRLPMDWLSSAIIRVRFGARDAVQLFETAPAGDPFVCGVHLVDDTQTLREAVTLGRCWSTDTYNDLRRNPEDWNRPRRDPT